MAKRKYQQALYWDEDDTLKKKRLTIDTAIINDDKAGKSWHLLDSFLVFFPQWGKTVAILSPRVEIPLSPFNKLTEKQKLKVRNIESIAQENLERRDNNAAQEQKKNRNAEFIKIALLFVGITFCLVMLMKGCSTSQFHFGFPGMPR